MTLTKKQKMLIAALEIEFGVRAVPVSNSEQTLSLDFNLFSLRFYNNDKVNFCYKSQQYLVNSIETADSVIGHIEEFKKEFSEMEERVNIFLNMSYDELKCFVIVHIEDIVDRISFEIK